MHLPVVRIHSRLYLPCTCCTSPVLDWRHSRWLPRRCLGLKASLVARTCPSKIKGSEPFSGDFSISSIHYIYFFRLSNTPLVSHFPLLAYCQLLFCSLTYQLNGMVIGWSSQFSYTVIVDEVINRSCLCEKPV